MRGAEPELNMTSMVEESGDCGLLGRMAPQCMKDCPAMCRPLKESTGKFLRTVGHGRNKAAMATLCKSRSAFKCGLDCVCPAREVRYLSGLGQEDIHKDFAA